MSDDKRTRTIAFRLTAEEFARIADAAAATGLNPNDWCRALVLAESGPGDGLSRNERLLYEEVARIRYLLGIGFGLLANDNLTPHEWERTKHAADHKGVQIAAALRSRR